MPCCKLRRRQCVLSSHSRGGMCEWLKQAVLKTAVRETVPGVRIPLPPPRSLDCRENPQHSFGNSAKWLQFRESPRNLRSTNGTGNAMVNQCANPDCRRELNYLRDGKIYQFVLSPKTGGKRPEHFRLSGECSKTMILIRVDQSEVKTVGKGHRSTPN